MACNVKYTQFETLDRDLKNLQRMLNTFKPAKMDDNCDYRDIVREQEETLNTLKSEFAVHMTDLEQRLVERSLRIHGIAEVPNEDTLVIVQNFFREKLNFVVTEQDIDFCHRCKGKSNPRDIVVKFINADIRKKAWKKKQAAPVEVTIDEELCPERVTVRNRARRAFGDENVSVFEGVIRVSLPSGKVEKFSTKWQLEVYLNDRK